MSFKKWLFYMICHGLCSNKSFFYHVAACWRPAPWPHFSSGGVWGGRGPPATREGHARVSLSGLLLLRRFSRVQLCATLWTAALQAPLSTGFSRQEHWSRLPFPSPFLVGEIVLTRKSGTLQCRHAATRGRPRRESKAGKCLRFALEKTLFKPFSDAASKGTLHSGSCL